MDHAKNDNAQTNATTRHRGSCHCGAIRFELSFDLGQGATRCNCSICTKLGPLTVIVAPEALRSLTPEGELTFYEWGAKVARRYFCKVCGVYTFSRGYLAEIGGAFASVNLNTLDDIDPSLVPVRYWDGRHENWQGGLRDTPWPIVAAAA